MRLSLSLLFILLVCTCAAAQITIPEPPADRPRVLVRPNTVDALKERLNHPAMAEIRADILAQYAAVEAINSAKVTRADYRAADAGALLYLLNQDVEAGRKAVELITTAFPLLNPNNEAWHEDRLNHRVIYSAALVYDWCYDLMTDAQRDFFYEQAVRLMQASEYGWPLTRGRITYLTNHFGEEKVPFALAFGIACYERHPDIYEEAAKHLYHGLVPTRNAFYPSHRHHQGASYGPGRYEMEVISAFIMTRMGAENPYIADQGKVPYHTIYNRRPDDVIFPEGDDFNHNFLYRGKGSGYFAVAGAFLAAQLYRDGYIQSDALLHEDFIDVFDHLNDGVLLLLYKDPTVEPQPVSDLPLTKFFNSPNASMTARTGWDPRGGADSPVAIATMTMSDYYYGNHDHLDAGHFNLYYKGALAMDSGAYAESEKGKGKHGGDSGHWNNYFRRSIAHNTLLVHDPDEPWRPTSIWDAQNEGGQVVNAGGPIEQYNGGAPLSFQHMADRGKQVELLAHGFGPDPVTPAYSYLKGDMAAAYHYNYLEMEPKVKEAKRSFVFLNTGDADVPGVLVVYDRVVSRKAHFAKRWLLHTIDEPEVTGSRVSMSRTPTRLDYSGKLVCETLLPEASNVTLAKIGGPGKDFWTESAQTNWALKKAEDVDRFEAGQWRIEVAPKAADTLDRFLHVLQAMEPDADALPTTRLEAAGLVGTQVGGTAVYFSTSGELLDGTITLSTDKGYLLLTDLAPGTWTVAGGGSNEKVLVSEDAGTIYLAVEKGSYTLRKG